MEAYKQKVIDFFDQQAPVWDQQMIRYEDVIARILDNAEVAAGKDVLDVACGTGVLIPDYLKRKVRSVTAMDISPEMVSIARTKFSQKDVRILCQDAETWDTSETYDCIVVYNAFPHFENPRKLIEKLSGLLRENGVLTIAHGMSRERIDQCHEGIAKEVSFRLLSEEALAELFSQYVKVTTKISDDHMYQVAGKKQML